MNNILYKDDKYELFYNETGMYIIINGDEYVLSCHCHEPCTYIKSKDKSVDIVMHNAFDLSFVVKDFENGNFTNAGNVYELITPLEFCKIINNEILWDKTKKKQEIVKETGYKTNNNTYIQTVKYYKGYYINELCEKGKVFGKTIDRYVVKYDDNGMICDKLEGNLKDLNMQEIKDKIDEKLNDKTVRIQCQNCRKIIKFDESKIPDGEKYEIKCSCGNLMIRKKNY